MSETVRSYRDLIIWQRAMDFAVEVYRLAKRFPKEEMFALTTQLRKAAASVAFNIAEGHARKKNEFQYFLSIASGSLAEAETQLLLAVRIGYLKEPELNQAMSLAEEIRRMAASLNRKLAN